MSDHVCPWWGGYFIDNWLRRWIHNPQTILSPFVQSGMRVMDIGCGMGLFAIGMAVLVGDDGLVIAVDLQQQMLDVLQKRAERAGVAHRIRAHRCSAESIAVGESLDFALAFYSAHEVPDQQNLMRAVFACLSPQGRFLIVEPKGHVPSKRFDAELALAQEAGFAVRERPHVRFSHAALLARPQ